MSQSGAYAEVAGEGPVFFLAGNNAGNVPPNASGVINVIGSGKVSVAGNISTNTLTISAGNNAAYNYTSVNNAASPYTVLVSDQFISVDSSGGAVSILLPNSVTTGQFFIIKDKTGSAAADHISVTTVGGTVTIDGSTTYTIQTNYQAISVLFDGTNYEVF